MRHGRERRDRVRAVISKHVVPPFLQACECQVGAAKVESGEDCMKIPAKHPRCHSPNQTREEVDADCLHDDLDRGR